MAPLSPSSSRKRPFPQGYHIFADEVNKRACVEPQSPMSFSPAHKYSGSKALSTMFNDDPHKLLMRSVTLALQHVGFSSATPEAMSALCDVIETYTLRLLSKVTMSMLNCRRSQPIPSDFQYALSQFDIPLLSIEPHLHPPIPISKLLIRFESFPADELPACTNTKLLGDDLSGEVDKKNKPFIPKKFPSFPSKHTYKWTEKESAREIDPRRVREEAAKVARQGEEALRHLTNVGKVAKEKDAKKTASKELKTKERHEIWECVMDSLLSEFEASSSSPMREPYGESRSMIVNAERSYFRKGSSIRRNLTQSTDPFESLRVILRIEPAKIIKSVRRAVDSGKFGKVQSAMSETHTQGARLLQEIAREECSLEDILAILRRSCSINHPVAGLPSSLMSLYHAHTSKGPLAIKSNPTTAASTALINHIVAFQLTIRNGAVALLDFTSQFSVSPIESTCGTDSLSHLHIFKPLEQSGAVFQAVKQWMLYGGHSSQGKEWVGTIIIGAEGTRQWDGLGGIIVTCGWNGWLNVARHNSNRCVNGVSVEDAWKYSQDIEPISWRAWCEEGEYKWE